MFPKPPKGTPYSDEVRAECLAILMQGNSLDYTAAHTGVSRRTLTAWRAQARAAPVANEEQKAQIGALIVDNLRMGLAAMTTIQQQFTDEEYVAKQSPSELATAFGIISDKSIRILEAFAPPEEED